MFYCSLGPEPLFIPQSQLYSSGFSHYSTITLLAKESYLLRQCFARNSLLSGRFERTPMRIPWLYLSRPWTIEHLLRLLTKSWVIEWAWLTFPSNWEKSQKWPRFTFSLPKDPKLDFGSFSTQCKAIIIRIQRQYLWQKESDQGGEEDELIYKR